MVVLQVQKKIRRLVKEHLYKSATLVSPRLTYWL